MVDLSKGRQFTLWARGFWGKRGAEGAPYPTLRRKKEVRISPISKRLAIANVGRAPEIQNKEGDREVEQSPGMSKEEIILSLTKG